VQRVVQRAVLAAQGGLPVRLQHLEVGADAGPSAEVARSLVRSGHSQADAARLSALLGERYGQSNRDRLRHVFKDVPVLYGFSSKAPLGRSAGPLLERYFQSAPAGEVASGRPSPTLLSLFAPSSMVAVEGLTDADPHAGLPRRHVRLRDDRPSHAQKIAFMHEVLQRDVTDVRMFLDHLEHYAASIGQAQRSRARGPRRSPRSRATAACVSATSSLCATPTKQRADPHDGAGAHAGLAVNRAGAGGVRAHGRKPHGPRQPGQDRGRSDLLGPPGRASRLARQLLATGAPRPGNVAHSAVLACLGTPRPTNAPFAR
jgi:hypothetical protein